MNKKYLLEMLDSFLNDTEFNWFNKNQQIKLFEKPLIGIAAANDPLFITLKEDKVVGNHHLTPIEWFPEANSVISYFLPFTNEVRASNRKDKVNPSLEWLHGRIEGEILNNEVRKFLSEIIFSSGGKVYAPAFDTKFKIINRKSNWSERHIAYIAGLGTFSLSKSLITEKGSAGRLGSVITNLKFEITKRKYNTFNEYCSNCGACIKRCPAQAINKFGKNDELCSNFLDRTKTLFEPRYGCGKCQTKTSCEKRVPK